MERIIEIFNDKTFDDVCFDNPLRQFFRLNYAH